MLFYIILITFFNSSTFYSQKYNNLSKPDSLQSFTIDPLRPAKPGFYSAILPGLGQIYNKKYWKVPLVYSSIGASMYFYVDSQKQYNIYRNEFKKRLAGSQSSSDYLEQLSDSQLISAQKQFKKNSDFSLLFALGFYALNIIDAHVDASLSQFNTNNQLSFKPIININDIDSKKNVCISCIYSF